MPDPEVRIKIKADGTEARKTFSDFAKEIPGVGRALDLLKNPVVALAGVFTALAGSVKASIAEFAQAEVQSARLDAALARSGQLTDEYRESLHELAGQLQKTTGIADDQWFEVLRKLTQFGANEGNIGQLAEGVKNLAGIMDGDLAGAANLVGRALQGNFEVLSRYGIQAKDLTTLLQELAVKGQGQLEAQTKTLIGTWQNLKNQINDLFEGVGGLINRFTPLKATVDLLAGSFEWWVEKIGNVQERLPGLSNAVDGSAKAQAAAAAATKKYADENARLDEHLTSITENLKAQNDELDKRKTNEEKVAEAAKRFELAQVDASSMSAPAKEMAKFGIESKYANQAMARENFYTFQKAQQQAGALSGLKGTDADLARQEAALQARVAAGRRQDSINSTLGANKEELQRTLAALEIASGLPRDSGGVFLPTAVGAQMAAQKLGFDYADLDPERLSNRANQLRRLIARGGYAPTTTAQDEAQLAAVRARRAGIAPQISAAAAGLGQFQAEANADFDTRKSVGAFDTATRAVGTFGNLSGGRDQARNQAANSITSGQGVDASLGRLLQEYDAAFKSMKKRVDEAIENLRRDRDGR